MFPTLPHLIVTDPRPQAAMPCDSETGASRTHLSLRLQWTTTHPTLDALFWDNVFSVDITPTEGLSIVTDLVNSPSKISEARSLQGDQAQSLIDLIDRVSDSSKRTSVPRILIMSYSSSRLRTSTRNCLCGARGWFTRSAKPAGFYPPRMSFNQSPSVSASTSGAAALRK